jgi:hypothetical protein
MLLCCGAGTVRKFPNLPPRTTDADRRPFRGEPEEYFSPFGWDAANQTFFRPVAQFFAVDPARESVNVNALDEVPDSSWFTNRLGAFSMTPAQVAQGACAAPPANPNETWFVTGAKPNGANPGFLIKTASGQRYLLKFDGVVEGPRPTAADVVGSRLYHAAGYFVPCNRIVHFDAAILKIAEGATTEDEDGDEIPLGQNSIDAVLAKSLRLADGRYRANASLFVDGKPIGPWTYEGTRGDDPNDVIPHQDRRDVRAMRLLAAWTNHFDSREQNTLASWMKTGEETGYVRHYVIDFGDCFGSIWEPPMLGRRIGHSNYFDVHHVGEDFITLGVKARPWDTARFGPSGAVFGYYDVEHFVPDEWQPGYPNPAFARMSDRDAAWMARILAHFDDAHVRASVEAAAIDPELTRELTRLLIGRRDRVLRRYLTRLSPLAHPRTDSVLGPASTPRVVRGSVWITGVDGGSALPIQRYEVCLDDLAVASGTVLARERSYASLAWDEHGSPVALTPGRVKGHEVCQMLPEAGPEYLMVDLYSGYSSTKHREVLRVHLHQVEAYSAQRLAAAAYRVVGVERLEEQTPPGE